ncbi:unnamed protein product [Timema podura]|uniref:Fibronectin type-III domain-containing protein n=1 Tax=Timema podura TaxID=61482 RepID=A0ABN7NKI4_TIMPD|nr:unnamed protein product [Timema podura]
MIGLCWDCVRNVLDRDLGKSLLKRSKITQSQHGLSTVLSDNDTYGYLSYGGGRGEWNDVILPAIASELHTQQMYYLIKGLESGTKYEAKVQAKNRFGWSQVSDSFQFYTRGLVMPQTSCIDWSKRVPFREECTKRPTAKEGMHPHLYGESVGNFVSHANFQGSVDLKYTITFDDQ